ncbi:MAG: twin-arginine translocase TatA/TatE family subunit [Candidatus Dormibacterales bacterium]
MPFHPLWLVVILVIVLIIFGPGRLPEFGGAVGKAMREFRKASNELTSEVTAATQAKPETPAAPAATAENTAQSSTSEANSPKS